MSSADSSCDPRATNPRALVDIRIPFKAADKPQNLSLTHPLSRQAPAAWIRPLAKAVILVSVTGVRQPPRASNQTVQPFSGMAGKGDAGRHSGCGPTALAAEGIGEADLRSNESSGARRPARIPAAADVRKEARRHYVTVTQCLRLAGWPSGAKRGITFPSPPSRWLLVARRSSLAFAQEIVPRSPTSFRTTLC
jgi:hypothetical protein